MIGLIIWTIVLVVGVAFHALAQSWYAAVSAVCVSGATVLMNGGEYGDLDDDDKKLLGTASRIMKRLILIAVLIMIAGIIGTVCSVAGMIG